MADSEVRQKFEAAGLAPMDECCQTIIADVLSGRDPWVMNRVRARINVMIGLHRSSAFEAGMREGEIARTEKVKEGACQDCGRENPVWFADNDVWNAVLPERVGFICPICFIRRADPIIQNTGWKLIPER